LVKKKNIGNISKVGIKFLRIIEGCTTLDKIKNEITQKGLSVHSVSGRIGDYRCHSLEKNWQAPKTAFYYRQKEYRESKRWL
jgi:hypothetical protein